MGTDNPDPAVSPTPGRPSVGSVARSETGHNRAVGSAARSETGHNRDTANNRE